MRLVPWSWVLLTDKCTARVSGRPRCAEVSAVTPASWARYGAAPAESVVKQGVSGFGPGDGVAAASGASAARVVPEPEYPAATALTPAVPLPAPRPDGG